MTIELKKDSNVRDLVNLFNAGEIRYPDIMELFQVSRDLIKARLTGIGLTWDNSQKKFVGEATEEDLNIKLSVLLEKQRVRVTKADASIQAIKETASTIETPVKENTNEIKAKASKKEVSKIATSKLDSIDLLLLQNNSESEQRVYRGFYWDADIINFLDNVKHGNKSDLMNEIVRTVLKDKGLI
ncbi:hypothetical protein [Peribacillus muralis]|uniref:hypothetical protein n=1 Tax=Peribacillus muralis TaxID=264697 RepID=UPI00070F89B2|nr:hypothetical protein [Peribacillus muralis]